MKVIDIHAHIILPETLNVLDDLGPEIGGTDQDPWFRAGNYRLEGVRYKNIDFTCVFSNLPLQIHQKTRIIKH